MEVDWQSILAWVIVGGTGFVFLAALLRPKKPGSDGGCGCGSARRFQQPPLKKS